MDIISYFFLFVFGTIIGSFLNVVILRYEPGKAFLGKQLLGHSHCPKCGKALMWYELMPILSFLFQLGKCRGCGQKISFQYPIVEILGGIIMLSAPFLGFTWILSSLWAIALFILLAASVIDLRHYVIPDGATIALVVIGAAMTWLEHIGLTGQISVVQGSFLGGYAYIFSFTQNVLLGHIAAAIALGAAFSLIILISRGRSMGWGDAKLAAAVGLMLGWPDAIFAIMIAFIIGALAGVSLMVLKVKTMKDALPFGPFISVGVMMIVFFGFEIMVAYFRFLNLGI